MADSSINPVETLRPKEFLPLDYVDMLRVMTDGVLEEAGYDMTDGQRTNVVTYKARLPRSQTDGYDLTIYSIADGVTGFNTSSGSSEADNSRRWVIYTDRGTSFGAAYDNKGTVYEDGSYERSGYTENFLTPLSDIIKKFHDMHEDSIEFELDPDLGLRVDQENSRMESLRPYQSNDLKAIEKLMKYTRNTAAGLSIVSFALSTEVNPEHMRSAAKNQVILALTCEGLHRFTKSVRQRVESRISSSSE